MNTPQHCLFYKQKALLPKWEVVLTKVFRVALPLFVYLEFMIGGLPCEKKMPKIVPACLCRDLPTCGQTVYSNSSLTLGAHAPEGYGSWVCVCVQSYLTIRPTNDTTYLTGNEGQNICGVFSENAPLQS